jgi:hypothetical protein
MERALELEICEQGVRVFPERPYLSHGMTIVKEKYVCNFISKFLKSGKSLPHSLNPSYFVPEEIFAQT